MTLQFKNRNVNNIVPEIGEEFILIGENGKKFKVRCEEADECDGCILYHLCNDLDINPTYMACYHEDREDGKDVIFKTIKVIE